MKHSNLSFESCVKILQDSNTSLCDSSIFQDTVTCTSSSYRKPFSSGANAEGMLDSGDFSNSQESSSNVSCREFLFGDHNAHKFILLDIPLKYFGSSVHSGIYSSSHAIWGNMLFVNIQLVRKLFMQVPSSQAYDARTVWGRPLRVPLMGTYLNGRYIRTRQTYTYARVGFKTSHRTQNP